MKKPTIAFVIKGCLCFFLCVFFSVNNTYAVRQGNFSQLRPVALAEKKELENRVSARARETIWRSLDPELSPEEACAFNYSFDVYPYPVKFKATGGKGSLLCHMRPGIKGVKKLVSERFAASLGKLGGNIAVSRLFESRFKTEKDLSRFAGTRLRCCFRARSGSPKRWIEVYYTQGDTETYLGDFRLDFSGGINNKGYDDFTHEELFFRDAFDDPGLPEARTILPLGSSGLKPLKDALARVGSKKVRPLLRTLRVNMKRGRWTHLALENKNITDEFGHCHRVIYGYFAKASDKYDGLEFSPKQFVTVLDSDHPDWLRQGVHSYLPAAELWAVGLLPAGDVPPIDIRVGPTNDFIAVAPQDPSSDKPRKVSIAFGTPVLLNPQRIPGFTFSPIRDTTVALEFIPFQYARQAKQRWPIELVERDGWKFIALRKPGTEPPISPIVHINVSRRNIAVKSDIFHSYGVLSAGGLQAIPPGYDGRKLYCRWPDQLRAARKAVADFFTGKTSDTRPWMAFDVRPGSFENSNAYLFCLDVFRIYRSASRIDIPIPLMPPFTGDDFKRHRFILTAPADGVITKQPYLRVIQRGLGAVYFYLENGKPAVCINSFNKALAAQDELVSDILIERHKISKNEAWRIAEQLKDAAGKFDFFPLSARPLADSVRIDRDPDITGDKDWAKTLPSGKPVLLVPFDLIDVRGRVVTAGLLVSPDEYTIINRERQPKAAAMLDSVQRENRRALPGQLISRYRQPARPVSEVRQRAREQVSGI